MILNVQIIRWCQRELFVLRVGSNEKGASLKNISKRKYTTTSFGDEEHPRWKHFQCGGVRGSFFMVHSNASPNGLSNFSFYVRKGSSYG